MNPGFIIILILWILTMIVFAVALYYRSKQKKPSKKFGSEFTQTALSVGLSKNEVKELKAVLVKAGITKPFLIFTDQSLLEKAVIEGVKNLEKFNLPPKEKEKAILNLFEIKRKVHLHFHDMGDGIENTRQIEANQLLSMKIQGIGTFYSIVIVNEGKNLVCSIPEIKDPASIPWKDKIVEVYFWRFNDAGYVFRTRIENVVYNKRMEVLLLAHSSKLKRIQRREYPRRKCRFNARFFKFSLSTNDLGKPVILLGRTQYGIVIDLSPGGLSIASDEVLTKNTSVKIEVDIEEEKLTAYGTVIKAVKKKNMFLMHVEFQRISDKNKNLIYRFVYKYF